MESTELADYQIPSASLLESAERVTGDWQAHVYIYPNRVLKVPKSLGEIELAITGGAQVSEERRREISLQALQVSESYFHGINMVQRLAVPRALLGSPEYQGKGVYWQERGIPIGDKLRSLLSAGDRPAAEEILLRWLRFCELLWSHGIHEVTFNFTCNVGARLDGTLFLLDFGELSNDADWISRELQGRRWERSWSYTRDLPAELRDVYRTVAMGAFTVDAFQKSWLSRVRRSHV